MGNKQTKWVSKPKGGKFTTLELDCNAFRSFNGSPDNWVSFKEHILGKTRAVGYGYFLKRAVTLTTEIGIANGRMYYLLKLATANKGASALINKFKEREIGHEAWMAVMQWYDGPILAGEITMTICKDLSNLCL